jgi:hypothetical protein
MAPKMFRTLFLVPTILLALTALPMLRVRADDIALPDTDFPSLTSFATLMGDGQWGELRGLYAPNLFADVVVQQPRNDATFVSTAPRTVTQFGPANSLGSTGLLAHNFLAGDKFSHLERGDRIYLVYGNGRVATYVVTTMIKYQALSPESPYSNFIDLSDGTLMSASSVFNVAYGRPGDVVLQTCIDANGDPSWGRLFIVAEPYVDTRKIQ